MAARRHLGRWVMGAVALVVAALLFLAYRPRPLLVEVVTVTVGPMEETIEEEGKIRVEDRYLVEAPIAGVASRIELHPGDPVKEGAQVASLRPTVSPLLDPQSRASAAAAVEAAQDQLNSARAQVDQANAARDLAEREVIRLRKLTDAGAVARSELDRAEYLYRARVADARSARYAVQVAAHELETARSVLGYQAKPGSDSIPLTSPTDGRVLRVLHESEGTVAAGTALLEVGDVSRLEVIVEVLTREAVQLRPGMRAVLVRWGGPKPLEGTVRRVEPAAQTKVSPLGVEEQRANVRVEVDPGPELAATLGDGYATDVRFITWSAERVLQVAATAVFRRGDGWAAFALEQGRARLREVKLGHRGALTVEILEGLTDGTEVIDHPSEQIEDGVRASAR